MAKPIKTLELHHPMIQFLITQTNYRVGWPIGSERLRWKASRCNLGENRRFANGDYQTFADEFFFLSRADRCVAEGHRRECFFFFPTSSSMPRKVAHWIKIRGMKERMC